MKESTSVVFDPDWRDDVFDCRALEISLTLPVPTPRDGDIWIEVRATQDETIFGQQHTYKPYRRKTVILKPSELSQRFTLLDENGRAIASDSSIASAIFPPKAWMSDSGEERCMMLAAAKLAKGHVLIGGLGLGIYPQFVLALGRPIGSITIVESDPQVIEIVTRAWLEKRPEQNKNVKIVEATIEDYLSTTEQVFDTIYLDTWDDADPRLLAYVNELIGLASPCCLPGGTVRCWGYASMVDAFIKTAKALTQQGFPWARYSLDPALRAYASWLEGKEGHLSEADIEQAARTCALTTRQPLIAYERHRCFSMMGNSRSEALRNAALS
ncbi:hypothetical protein [cf. Phormidesmis sp. LEGE 11477]|uniref:hypothetical protein n=1 Tax=cf. Phormidesmis sp. LEGE 11477 TaxID=1828680 RepID=UPI001882C1C3|nr:hypothetical protein [cf. Phormidesmis sp. LEGE 11477]MBE9060389.1 hypothetical protein [cf. Phormidesmis sp. LEGE 11477]